MCIRSMSFKKQVAYVEGRHNLLDVGLVCGLGLYSYTLSLPLGMIVALWQTPQRLSL